MKVQEGDLVAQGQEIALLDMATYESLCNFAFARADAQRAVVSRMKAGSRPEEIARDRASVVAYQAVLFNAQRGLDRRQTLLGQGFAAQQEFEQAQATARQTHGLKDAAKQTLHLRSWGREKPVVLRDNREGCRKPAFPRG